jgi:activator of 2-hydroxyglutaryl-CoA dehydratase
MAFVGGVAKNEGMRRALESYLSRRFLDINGDAQLTGAIGAAVIAMEQGLK